jgi:WD40 repeat protein
MAAVRSLLAVVASLTLAAPGLNAADPPVKGKDAKEPDVVSYYRDIRPIFQLNCQGCHQPAIPKGDYVMTSVEAMLKAGEKGNPCVVPGKPDESYLVELITSQDGKSPTMPKGKDELPEREVNLIKKWIAQGANDDSPAAALKVVDGKHPPVYEVAPVITTLAYSPDSSLLAISGYHEVLLYKADGSELVARLVGLSERVQSVAFSPDGKLLAVAGGSPCRFGEVQIWDVERHKLKMALPFTFDTLYGVSWSPDGTKIAFGCADNTLRAIDTETGKQILYQGAHNDWVLDTVFSKDGSHLVSVSRDGSMKLTEVATQRFIDNITSITPGALKGGLQTVDRSPVKDELLIGGADGTPKIYQMYRDKKRVIGDDFNHIHSFAAMPGRVFAARFNSDGTKVVVGSSLDGQGEVRVYQAATRPDPQLVSLCGLTSPWNMGLSSLLLMPTARYSGHLVCKCAGEHGPVYTVAFRPDGQQVASAGFDGVVRLNDPQTGALIKEFIPVPLSNPGVATGNK